MIEDLNTKEVIGDEECYYFKEMSCNKERRQKEVSFATWTNEDDNHLNKKFMFLEQEEKDRAELKNVLLKIMYNIASRDGSDTGMEQKEHNVKIPVFSHNFVIVKNGENNIMKSYIISYETDDDTIFIKPMLGGEKIVDIRFGAVEFNLNNLSSQYLKFLVKIFIEEDFKYDNGRRKISFILNKHDMRKKKIKDLELENIRAIMCGLGYPKFFSLFDILKKNKNDGAK